MMRGLSRLFALASLMLTAAAARAELGDIEWLADGSAAREFQVAPGKFAEWCGKLQRGEKVQWTFEAAGPLNFNVHYHLGKDVRFPAKQDGIAKAQGTLDVLLDQDYCWMWTNKSASTVALKAGLRKAP
jgi:hypothetical protein